MYYRYNSIFYRVFDKNIDPQQTFKLYTIMYSALYFNENKN